MKPIMQSALAVSLALIATSGMAHAQHTQPPPPPPPPPAEAQDSDESEDDEIVVTGEAPEQVRIDRRTYNLRDDPSAATSSVFDVLGRLPSVSVAPSGAIRLLGAQGVTIQVNGQPVPDQAIEQTLRSLNGSDVERIEVITNPSATQSAAGSGGIINIITRQRFTGGLSGNVQASADTIGSTYFGVAPTWTQGPWSYGDRAGVFHNVGQNDIAREREDLITSNITTEDGRLDFEGNGWNGNLALGYRTQERRVNASLDSFAVENVIDQTTLRADDLGPIAEQTQNNESTFGHDRATFDFQQNGAQPGELFKFNASWSRFANGSNNMLTVNPAGGGVQSQFLNLFDTEQTTTSLRTDYERPFSGDRFLSVGAAIDLVNQETDNAFQTLAGPPGPPDFQARLDGAQQTVAGYGTYQFKTGDWTWLPGVRAENYRREVVAGGLETDRTELEYFPSLHIRREITDEIDLDLSYSRRIERPGIGQLDPSLRFFEPTRAFGGNPNLRPTFTDAYEANVIYQKGQDSISVTLFDRISDDIVSQFAEPTGGVTITRPVNAGTSEQRGLQAILRGPIGGSERWRYSLSANLLNREFDVLNVGVISRREEFEYGGNAQLEYRDTNQNAIGANHLQLEVQFQGPRYTLQGANDEFVLANLTWRRRLTDKLSSIVTVQDIFDSAAQRAEVTTADYFERIENRGVGTRLRLAFTYQLGSGPERPQDRQQIGPPQVGQPPV